MKQNFDEREYQAVIDEVPQFNAQIEAIEDRRHRDSAAAATEWSTLNTEVSQVRRRHPGARRQPQARTRCRRM